MKVLLAVAVLFFAGCKEKKFSHPRILIETGYGDIEAELYPDKAPKTVAAVLSFIDSGYYRDASFYRVIQDDDMASVNSTGLIQGGTWPAKPVATGIPHESTSVTGLSHTDGVLSLARTGPGTATTEFFICLGDQRQFDAGAGGGSDSLGFAAFGKVVKGMDVVRKIHLAKSSGDRFSERIPINSFRVR